MEGDVEKLSDDESDDEDQLLVSPIQNSDDEDIVPTQFQMNQLNEDYIHEHETDDGEATQYDSAEFRANVQNHDWTLDREYLCSDMSVTHMNSATDWIENKK